MATKLKVNRDGIDIELEGEELEKFLAQREIDLPFDQAELEKFKAEKDSLAEKKQSAIDKLAALGLSAEEVKALFA